MTTLEIRFSNAAFVQVNSSRMPKPLDPATKEQLIARVNYYREMGIHDFYRRPAASSAEAEIVGEEQAVEPGREMLLIELREDATADKPAALKVIRADIGDCTRCRLH